MTFKLFGHGPIPTTRGITRAEFKTTVLYSIFLISTVCSILGKSNLKISNLNRCLSFLNTISPKFKRVGYVLHRVTLDLTSLLTLTELRILCKNYVFTKSGLQRLRQKTIGQGIRLLSHHFFFKPTK